MINNNTIISTMKQYIIPSLTAIILLSACGNSKKKETAEITERKTRLEKLKADNDKNSAEMAKLQAELLKLDPNSNPSKIKLVATAPVVKQDFNHYIDLQGTVDAENISYISPRMGPGQVKAVYVKQGDRVKKGQLLLKLDDAIQRQQVASIKQQAAGIKTQLTLARSLAQRQQNLWNQGIGTEVQLLTAKTNVTSLENQLQQINEQVKLGQEQLNTANVYSDVSGVADVVNIRVGETFQGMTAAGPQIKVVNTSSLKVVGTIPENYLGSVQKGTPVVVSLPDAGRTFNSTVSFIGASIDILNRGFVVEAKLPADPALKPNQIASLKIRDYSAPNTLAIPLNTLQNDEKGKFVMVAVAENGKLIARKRPVTIGMLNDDLLEIKGGLKEGDLLVTEGFASIYEGQQLTVAK
ncbi:MAG: efflux RND transporter periplasmic adaptor subunit [Chitinophagaceae bacterium]|nr:MAG: efflux RND transporter periplasmic adaptor subunit [Chitinophagaceae bacterium]